MPKSPGSMPTPSPQHCQRISFSLPDTQQSTAADPDSLDHEAFTFHLQESRDAYLDSIEEGPALPFHSPRSQELKDAHTDSANSEAFSCLLAAESKSITPMMLEKYSDVSVGVDACTESKDLWLTVQAVQKQQAELAQTLDVVVLQLQEQMRAMKSEIVRTQLELSAYKKQRGGSESSQSSPTIGSNAFTVHTAYQEDVHQLPCEREVLQQHQQKHQVDSLKHDIVDIAHEVCEIFAEPLYGLTQSVRRAESDMEKMRSVLMGVKETQERHIHGAHKVLEQMVHRVFDFMNSDDSHSTWPAAVEAHQSEAKVGKDQFLGLLRRTRSAPRITHPIKLKVQQVSATASESSESRRSCGATASVNHGHEIRSNATTCASMKEISQYKNVYIRSQAATQVGVT